MRSPAPLLVASFMAVLVLSCALPNQKKPVVEKKIAYVPPGSSPVTKTPANPLGTGPLTVPSPVGANPFESPPAQNATPGPPDGTVQVSTLAGSGTALFADGPGTQAGFNGPTGLALAPDGALIVADTSNHVIRRVDLMNPAHPVTTIAGRPGGGDAAIGSENGDTKTARFHGPIGVAVAADGRIFVADAGNHCIRLIQNGQVSTLAGQALSGAHDGPGLAAGFVLPTGLALDAKGGLIITDSLDNRVRRLDLSAQDHPVVSLAGNGDAAARDGVGGAASFNSPFMVVVDAGGNALVADPGNRRVRKIAPDGTTTSLQVGPTTGLLPFQPSGVAVRPDGSIIVTDVGNHRILEVPPAKVGFEPATRVVAGNGEGHADGTGVTARFNTPEAVVVGPDGTLYVADTLNNQIRAIRAGGTASTTPAATAAVTASGAATAAATPTSTPASTPTQKP